MVDPFFGSVLSAAASLAGGLFGQSSQDKANERAANEAAQNRRLQDEVNRRGLTMRADDAMNAYRLYGIHPLAMLGVQGPTYSPVTTAFLGGNPAGEGIARAGQDISRGLHATADRELREVATKIQMDTLALSKERAGLENEALRVKIASDVQRLSQGAYPVVPSPGTNVVGPSWEYVKTPSGYMLLKSNAAQQRLEDDVVGTSIWNVGHRGAIPPIPPPRGVRLSAGEKWVWRPVSQEWQIKRLDKSDIQKMMPFYLRGTSRVPADWSPDFIGVRR